MIKFVNFENDEYIKELSERLNDISIDFIYFFQKDDGIKSRLSLRKLVAKENPLKTILVSPYNLSELAWKANLFHFIQYEKDNVESSIENLRDKMFFIKSVEKIPKKLKMKHSNGFDIIDIGNILYCKGDGNYSTIYMDDFKKKVYTIQLHKLNIFLSKYPNIERIGKSFIINLNEIQAIKKDHIVFLNDETKILHLSELMVSRIKKKLIWH